MPVDAAMRKLPELANAMETESGSVAEYVAAMRAAIAHGFLTMHPSGGYVTFTQADAELFA
jgi:hypothetical protein